MDLVFDDEEKEDVDGKENFQKNKDTTVLLEDADFLDNEKEKIIIHDLMNSKQGQLSIIENIAKRCLETLKQEIDLDFNDAGIKILKIDILDECEDIIVSIPKYLLIDDSDAKRLLYKQITVSLGMLVERMLFKYKNFIKK